MPKTPCENKFENILVGSGTDLYSGTSFAISILVAFLTSRMLRRLKHSVACSREFKEQIARTALFCSNCSFLRCDVYVEPHRIFGIKYENKLLSCKALKKRNWVNNVSI